MATTSTCSLLGAHLAHICFDIGGKALQTTYQTEKATQLTASVPKCNAVIATRCFRLVAEGSLSMISIESYENFEQEIFTFFEKCLENPSHARRHLFRYIVEQSDTYPILSQHPLFIALSQGDWPPESLRSDKSIPGDIYNDDLKLFHHFLISFAILVGSRPWERLRLFGSFHLHSVLPYKHQVTEF